MKKNNAYILLFSEIKEEVESFEFQLDQTFFSEYKSPEWESGDVDVALEVTKRSDGFTFQFSFTGQIQVICDRCLDLFPHTVDHKETLFVKLGEESEEMDNDVVMIAREANQIDLSQLLYEYMVVLLPVKKAHPEGADGEPTCNAEMMDRLMDHTPHEEEEATDPRWDDLKKLMDKK